MPPTPDIIMGGYGQIEATLVSNPAKRLSLGYSSSYDAAFIESLQTGGSYQNLLINPNGGKVCVGCTAPSTSQFFVFSDSTP